MAEIVEEIVEEVQEKPDLLTEEEVTKRIEAVRKEEKDKLYKRIEELTGKVTTLTETQKAEVEAKNRIQEDAAKKEEEARRSKLSTEDRMVEQMRQFEEKLDKERVERLQLTAELAQERNKAELREYRDQVLAKYGDDIIPDMVVGNSREEIDNKAALAQTRFKELFDRAFEKQKGPQKREPGIPSGPRLTNPDPAALEEAELAQQLSTVQVDTDRYFGNRAKGISRDQTYRHEIDAKRDQLTRNLEKAYRNAGT